MWRRYAVDLCVDPERLDVRVDIAKVRSRHGQHHVGILKVLEIKLRELLKRLGILDIAPFDGLLDSTVRLDCLGILEIPASSVHARDVELVRVAIVAGCDVRVQRRSEGYEHRDDLGPIVLARVIHEVLAEVYLLRREGECRGVDHVERIIYRIPLLDAPDSRVEPPNIQELAYAVHGGSVVGEELRRSGDGRPAICRCRYRADPELMARIRLRIVRLDDGRHGLPHLLVREVRHRYDYVVQERERPLALDLLLVVEVSRDREGTPAPDPYAVAVNIHD